MTRWHFRIIHGLLLAASVIPVIPIVIVARGGIRGVLLPNILESYAVAVAADTSIAAGK